MNFLRRTLSLDFKSSSPIVINNIICDFLNTNFPDYTAVYTNGLISPLSVGYSIYIPELICPLPIIYYLTPLSSLLNATPLSKHSR